MGYLGRHLLLLFALVALTASTALLLDSLHPAPLFCSYEMGCVDVLASPYARLLGVPLPVLGLLAFALLFGLTLFPPQGGSWLLPVLTLAVGAAGLALILVQVLVLEQVCPLCMLVDLAALAMAGTQLVSWRMLPGGALPGWARWGWLGLGSAVLAVTVTLGLLVRGPEPRPVPEEVRARWVAGKVNIVEIADFDCPHCRLMHGVLQRLLALEGDRVHLVRVIAPMPNHPSSRPAARVYLCADKRSKGPAMAEALFEAPDLSSASCERLAAELGIPGRQLRACVADPATDQQINATIAWVKEACPDGLPVLWIQEEMVFGLQPLDVLHEKVIAAERRLHRAE